MKEHLLNGLKKNNKNIEYISTLLLLYIIYFI